MNETSASGSAPAASCALTGSPSDRAAIFCALNAGMLAESSDTESDRLPATRTKGRTRTISRLPLPRLVVDTRMTCRAALASPGGGRRSALRVATRSTMRITALRSAPSTRSGTVAKLVSPSRAAKTAPLIRAAPQRPVRMTPLSHCTETRRRSTKPLLSPSTDNGGSLPRSMCSASKVERSAACLLPCSKPDIPHARGRFTATPKVSNATGTTGVDLKHGARRRLHGPSTTVS